MTSKISHGHDLDNDLAKDNGSNNDDRARLGGNGETTIPNGARAPPGPISAKRRFKLQLRNAKFSRCEAGRSIPFRDDEEPEMESSMEEAGALTSPLNTMGRSSTPVRDSKPTEGKTRPQKTARRRTQTPSPTPGTSKGDILLSPERRKRGRPATTGAGVGIREREEREAQEKRERDQARLYREVAAQIESGILSRGKTADPTTLIPEKESKESVAAMPTNELSAGITECLGAISLISKRSGNLQGRFQGVINRAVNNMTLAVAALTVRLTSAEGGPEASSKLLEEMRELREEVRAAKAETCSVQAEMARLKQQLQQQHHQQQHQPPPPSQADIPPPLPPPPPTTRGQVGCSSQEWPTPQEARGLPQRKARNKRPHETREGTSTMEIDDVPSFDDNYAQEEAGPPVGCEAAVWRPPVLGVRTQLSCVVPGVQEADRGRYQVLTDKIGDLVGLKANCKEGSPEEDAYALQIEELLLRREALKGRHATMDVPTPAPRLKTAIAALRVAAKASPSPLPSSTPPKDPSPVGPEGDGGQGGTRGKKKKKKKKKSRGGQTATSTDGPAPAPPPPDVRAPTVPPPKPQRVKKGAATTTAPIPPAPTDQQWSKVVGRREKKAGRQATGPTTSGAKGGGPAPSRPAGKPPPGGASKPSSSKGKKGSPMAPKAKEKGAGKAEPRPLPKPPKSAAVTITCTNSKAAAEFMAEARQKISLAEAGIEGPLKIRKGMTGALILEVGGAEATTKADLLAARLREVAAGREDSTPRIQRPVKMAAIRIRDLEDSLSKEEIGGVVAGVGGCTPAEVSVGDFTEGPRRSTTVVARCPLAAAIKAAAAGRIQLGWVRSRVELLEARPLICYKCLEKGHVRGQCRSSIDRSSYCYTCGDPGHRAKGCRGQPSCPVCKEAGRPHNYKVGGPACKPPSKKRRGGNVGAGGSKGGGKEAPTQATPVIGAGDQTTPTPMDVEGPEGAKD